MEHSESSRSTREKPPIAIKPTINFKILTSTSERILNRGKDCENAEGTSTSRRRRCESFHHELGVNSRHSPLNDSVFSGSLKHLETMEFGDFSPADNNEEISLSFKDVSIDTEASLQQEYAKLSEPETTKDTILLDGDVATKTLTINKADLPMSNTSLLSEEHNDFNNVEYLHTNLEQYPSPQSNQENANENFITDLLSTRENVDAQSSEWQGAPSSIPDIISDHIIPRVSSLSPARGSDDPSDNSGLQGHISANAENQNIIESSEDTQDVANEGGVDNDDPGDELVDLQSRRAILRGHSIRISRSVHQRHPSRLPSVVDPSNASPHNISSTTGQVRGRQSLNHLPKGWESRIDIYGRVFYIDHISRCTTWKKPEAPSVAPQRSSMISEEDRRLMDRRYQSLRRSLRLGAVGGYNSQREEGHDSLQSYPSNPQESHEAQKFVEDGEPIMPGAAFLSRPDFFTLLQNNQTANEEYNLNSSLKHMVNKIRRDYPSFKELQHRKDLVAFVNHFTETNRPLPDHWEVKMDKSNKPYYIDHNLKITTYIDPRLPPLPHFQADILRGPGRSSMPTLQEGSEGNIDYHDRVVSFLRQPNILDILKSKYPLIMSSMTLKNKVNLIRCEGQQGIMKLKNDLELTMMLSIFEEDIMTYVAPGSSGSSESPFAAAKAYSQGHHRSSQKRKNLDLKLNEFYARLDDRGFSKANVKYRLIVRRDRILQDGYDKIMSLTKKDLQRSKLVIAFKGEDGLDYGGPSREFFFLLSRELFNPYYGLFSYSANDTYTVQVSPTSSQIENYLGWFRFAGRIIALALIHQYLLDVFFTRVFYKRLLHLKPCLSDLESLDLEFYRSLAWINDKATGGELESMCLTFSVTEEVEDDENEPWDYLDEEDFKGRKGLLGWFDGIVRRKSNLERERRRSKSNPRSQRLMATSALNINSASTLHEYNNFLTPQRRISTHLEPTSRNFESATPTPLPNSKLSPLLASASQSTECLPTSAEVATKSPNASKVIERELKANGRNIPVTERNKKEYIERMINWRVKRGTQRQMEALMFGFNEILEPKLLTRFDAHELELVIAGSLEIDIIDWRANTNYRSGYSDSHQVISWFWNVVASYDNNQRLRLLQFVTGTSSIPVEGFAALRGSTGPKKFCIEKWGKVTDLPRAHTCFNRLDLPPYTSYNILLEKLTIAVEETSTFGIE